MSKQEKKKKLPIGKLIRRFAAYAWDCSPAYFIFYVIKILVYSLSPFIGIIFPARFVDEIVGQKRPEQLILYAALTVGLTTLSGILKNISDQTLSKYADSFERYIDMKMVEKCISMDFQYTEDKKVLEQIEKAKQGMSWYSGGIHGIMNRVANIIFETITLLGVAFLLLSGMPWLVVVYLCSLAIEAYLTLRVNQIQMHHFLNLSKLNQVAGYIFWELQEIKFGKDIRLYGAEEIMEDKARKNTEESTSQWRNQAKSQLPYEMTGSGLSEVRNVITLLLIASRAVKKLISIGDFTMYFNASNTMYYTVRNIVTGVQDIYQKLVYANEFIVFMDYPDAVYHGHTLPDTNKEHTIEFRDVSFAYPKTDQLILKHINIVLHPGEHISVVGLNGAGKTTFIKLLCRLYDPTEGQILLDGTDIRELEYNAYMQLLSAVFQDFQLFAFTARENVTLRETAAKTEDIRKNEEKLREEAKDRKRRKVHKRTKGLADESDSNFVESDKKFDEVLAQTELAEVIGQLKYGADTYVMKGFDAEGSELSGGQQQKLAIARALYKDAAIVILDEPTAALDPIAEYEIYRQFSGLVGGKTAIYISHRLSSCQFCDIIYVFVDGEIREVGTHEELVAMPDGNYAKMFEAQAEYYR